MDRLSELPLVIIQHILAFLSKKEAAQTSVLSKTWLCAWSCYPILDFDEGDFVEYLTHPNQGTAERVHKFSEFVDGTLTRYRERKIGIRKFRLHADVDANLDSVVVDNWIAFAAEKHPREVDLKVRTLRGSPPYVLPHTAIAALSSTLRRLDLHRMYLDEPMIQNLISTCRWVEDLTLTCCKGFKKIQVINLHLLNVFSISAWAGDDIEIDIEAPNVKRLYFCGVRVSDTFIDSLASKCPLLDDLAFERCVNVQSLKISSQTLKRFTLILGLGDSHVETKIDAPSLLSLFYGEKLGPSLSLTNTPSLLKTTFTFRRFGHLDTAWFLMLREILSKSSGPKVVNLTIFATKNGLNIENLSEIPVSHNPKVEKLILSSRVPTRDDIPDLFDALFWSCHPESIVISGNLDFGSQAVKFLSEELVDRGNRNCCTSHPIKCWRHHLKAVEIHSEFHQDSQRTGDSII